MQRVLVPLFCVTGLTLGCSTVSQGIDIAPLRPPYKVTVYENGHPVAEREISAGSDEADLIVQWLAANRSGWTSTPATYAPHRLVSGDSFSLNFGEEQCVLNHGGRQLYKKGDMSGLSQVFDK